MRHTLFPHEPANVIKFCKIEKVFPAEIHRGATFPNNFIIGYITWSRKKIYVSFYRFNVIRSMTESVIDGIALIR